MKTLLLAAADAHTGRWQGWWAAWRHRKAEGFVRVDEPAVVRDAQVQGADPLGQQFDHFLITVPDLRGRGVLDQDSYTAQRRLHRQMPAHLRTIRCAAAAFGR
ncbi:hypothetical protein [Streptomyces sp. NPDC018059]|uniref:hypothetical protein n=1 Tax=Streptomyces sp. NPDC018059 TaxID=3365041 RepID=UPI00378DFC6A